MKRMKWILFAALAGLLILTPVTRLSAQATAGIVNTRAPFSIPVWVPCADNGNGELVTVSGTLHTLFQMTVNAKGGAHTQAYVHTIGATGVGDTTGDVYRARNASRSSTTVGSDGVPFIGHFVQSLTLNGPRGGVDLRMHLTIHLTITAHGATAQVVNASSECQ